MEEMEEMEEMRGRPTIPQEVHQEDTQDSSHGDTFGLWIEGILLVEINSKFYFTILSLLSGSDLLCGAGGELSLYPHIFC